MLFSGDQAYAPRGGGAHRGIRQGPGHMFQGEDSDQYDHPSCRRFEDVRCCVKYPAVERDTAVL